MRHTVFHPQWFVYHGDKQKCLNVNRWVGGRVLDIGCADSSIKQSLSKITSYIGLDYYTTAVNWYQTRPDIYGDAHILPIASESIDSVLLMDVLEHLQDPGKCIDEIIRVLRPGGIFYLQVPFIYPEHDAPLDFHRWTKYGLHNLSKKHALEICDEKSYGKPIETATLLYNIALSKTLLNWLQRKSPALVFSPAIPLAIVLVNLLGWLLAKISFDDGMMAYSHCLVLRKQQ